MRLILSRLAMLFMIAGVVCISLPTISNAGAFQTLASQEKVPSFNSSHWHIEKYTINLHSGTGEAVQNWSNKYLCNKKTECASDIGCGNLRAWCTIALPYTSPELGGRSGELHFVDAPTLHDSRIDGILGMDWWINYFEALNGELDVFNAFMHNKAQFYVTDLQKYEEFLGVGDADVAVMKRSSLDSDGVGVAHLGFTIAGRVYELVAPLTSVTDSSEYVSWEASTECPSAHTLTSTLSQYAALSSQSDDDWDGEAPIMLIGISMSYHDPTDKYVEANTPASARITTLYDHIQIVSGASTEVETDTEACVVTKISWPSMEGLAIRYVHNRKAPTGVKSLKDFDDYVYHDHMTYNNVSGYGWDHMLDQHVGLWYSGPEDSCLARAASVRALIDGDGIPRGERGEPDAHEMYTGYAGPMTWEYQFQNCDAGRPEATEECACVADNNADHYESKTGLSCTEDDDGWCT